MTSNIDTKLRVLIYDDERGSALGIKEELQAVASLDLRLLENAKEQVELLEQRRRAARSSKSPDDERSDFDEADVLIVDYDLTASGDQEGGPAETGERVAYLARCYSNCGTIVALNQFSVTATFDLGLIGHISSYADLNVSGDQIANPALWGRPQDGFSPWSWPNLLLAPALQRTRTAALSDQIDESALKVLGLETPNIASTLNRNQLAWLSSSSAPGKTTVRDVVQKGRLGFRPNDQPWDDKGIERVAAARLAKWLERLVLPGQNVLVDAPHLVSRFPSLVSSDALDSTTVVDPTSSAGLDAPNLRPHRFAQSTWLSRPAWLWPTVSEDREIVEVRDPFKPVSISRYFTEESSVFRAPDFCRAFAADVEPFSRRFVTRAPLLTEVNSPPFSGKYGLHRVQYQPQIRFAL